MYVLVVCVVCVFVINYFLICSNLRFLNFPYLLFVFFFLRSPGYSYKRKSFTLMFCFHVFLSLCVCVDLSPFSCYCSCLVNFGKHLPNAHFIFSVIPYGRRQTDSNVLLLWRWTIPKWFYTAAVVVLSITASFVLLLFRQ